MKKQFCLILLLCFLFQHSELAAQKKLYLVNTKTGKEKCFKTGKYFEYKLQNWQNFDGGTLVEVSSVMIQVDDSPVDLKDIKEVRKRSGAQTMLKIIGAPLVAAGMGIFLKGSIDAASSSFSNEDAYLWMGAGAGAVAIGIIPFRIKNKKYILGNEWKLQAK